MISPQRQVGAARAAQRAEGHPGALGGARLRRPKDGRYHLQQRRVAHAHVGGHVVGRIFRMNAVLQRDSVKKRLKTDQGTGFLDYSYQLFRADDFLHLHRNYGCVALIGASE
ncbi:hypothetical protein PRIC1_009745 [Phytophthora ramorum]|uniref:Tyrosine--tRNA ligase n=1 Tax=Phytophthora ramorum TaxID=164328 RepID=UPI0030A7F19F|nr:Tyrosine--tRNA ligase [Phytophthora ramorum]KAH7504393.1 Tyrosine--tRNA ligase [Phytophthora ramorum]